MDVRRQGDEAIRQQGNKTIAPFKYGNYARRLAPNCPAKPTTELELRQGDVEIKNSQSLHTSQSQIQQLCLFFSSALYIEIYLR